MVVFVYSMHFELREINIYFRLYLQLVINGYLSTCCI